MDSNDSRPAETGRQKSIKSSGGYGGRQGKQGEQTPAFFVNGRPLIDFSEQGFVDLVKSQIDAAD
jgi:hypothetical protein